jgi:hypothetical protein
MKGGCSKSSKKGSARKPPPPGFDRVVHVPPAGTEREIIMKNVRLLSGLLGLCGVVLLGGCAVGPGYVDSGYGYGGGYNGGYSSGYGGYGRPYYSEPAPVVVSPPVYINGGYYDSPGYYGRPGYQARPGYARPDYDRSRPSVRPGYNGNGNRPGRPDGGVRPGSGSRPGSFGPGPSPDRVTPVSPSMPIESQRILRERAQESR